MFKGIYNRKQYHSGDIQAVLERAWNAGVDRIIVSFFSFPILQCALLLLVIFNLDWIAY